MANNFDEKRVQEILGILKSNPSTSIETTDNQNPQSFEESRVQEAMKVLRGTSLKHDNDDIPETEKEFSWPRFIGERFTKGALGLADLLGFKSYQHNILDPDSETLPTGKLSDSIKSIAKEGGIDIESQGTGNTPVQRIIGKGAEFAGGSLIPGGGIPGLVKNVALGSAIGAGSGGLEEIGTPEPIATLASLGAVFAGAPALKNAIKKAISGVPNLSEAEKRVANYLQQVLGEEGVKTVGKNISEAPVYPTTGYEPTTAEVANSPFVSTLHRLRQGIPGTGLQERAAAQNEAIHTTSDKLSLDAVKSPHIKETIAEELANRKATRHKETNPLYEELHKDKTQKNPENVKRFLEENKGAKGKKRKDLDMVKKLIEPSEKLTLVEESALKNYENQIESINNSKMSTSAKEKAIAQLENPKSNHPTVADLDEARQNINDTIRDLKKRGQNNRVRQLKEAIKELDKDLADFPLQKEATEKYAQLSELVNEIAEHPALKNIPENRVNNIFDGLFNSKSADNFTSLKQVLKDRPNDWKGIQDATVEYLMKSIKNAGSEGRRNVLSYHKLDKFLEKHGKALDEVFTTDQMKFLDELNNALKGRNIAETSGIEKQSATYGKLITGTNLTEGFGSKILKGATYIPHAIPKIGKPTGDILRTMINRYFKTRESNVMEVLDNFLKNPEYAPKLLNHKFKTQNEFNNQMDSFAKQITTTIATTKDKEKDKK